MNEDSDDLKPTPAGENVAAGRAMHDPVTGLPNPALFADRLMVAISLAKRNDWLLAVMLIDLGTWAGIADAQGRDPVRKAIASRLSLRARGGDTVSQDDDNHLLYLLVNPDSRENIRRVAQKASDRMMQPLVVETATLVLAPRIGIAVFPEDGVTGPLLVAHAQAAMQRAKREDLSYMFFEPAGTDNEA